MGYRDKLAIFKASSLPDPPAKLPVVETVHDNSDEEDEKELASIADGETGVQQANKDVSNQECKETSFPPSSLPDTGEEAKLPVVATVPDNGDEEDEKELAPIADWKTGVQQPEFREKPLPSPPVNIEQQNEVSKVGKTSFNLRQPTAQDFSNIEEYLEFGRNKEISDLELFFGDDELSNIDQKSLDKIYNYFAPDLLKIDHPEALNCYNLVSSAYSRLSSLIGDVLIEQRRAQYEKMKLPKLPKVTPTKHKPTIQDGKLNRSGHPCEPPGNVSGLFGLDASISGTAYLKTSTENKDSDKKEKATSDKKRKAALKEDIEGKNQSKKQKVINKAPDKRNLRKRDATVNYSTSTRKKATTKSSIQSQSKITTKKTTPKSSTIVSETQVQSKSERRSVTSRPQTICQVKGEIVVKKFRSVSHNMKQLQQMTTWKNQKDRNEKPICQHILLVVDELVPTPSKVKLSRYKREEGPTAFFQLPQGIDKKAFGKRLVQIGKAMERGSGKEYVCTEDPKTMLKHIFDKTA